MLCGCSVICWNLGGTTNVSVSVASISASCRMTYTVSLSIGAIVFTEEEWW